MNDQNLSPDQNERTLAGLGYFGFIFVLPLAIRSDSEYCRFHGKQSLVFNLFFFLGASFIYVLSASTSIFYFHLFLIFVWLVLMAFFASSAFSGKSIKIPVAYDISKKLVIFKDEIGKIQEQVQQAPVQQEQPQQEQQTQNTPQPPSQEVQQQSPQPQAPVAPTQNAPAPDAAQNQSQAQPAPQESQVQDPNQNQQ